MKLAFILISVAAAGQTFEVTTVKAVDPNGMSRIPAEILNSPAGDAMRFGGGPGSSTPNRIDYVGVTLQSLLQRAYNVKAQQISGLGSHDERYDIAATMAPGTNAEQLRLMLQHLLAERFRVSLHWETETMRVYLLTVAKGGPRLKPPLKLQEHPDDEEGKAARRQEMLEELKAAMARNQVSGPFQVWTLASATVEKFVRELSSRVDRPVVDRTGLEGLYSFSLDWLPDGSKPRENIPLSGPSIFIALEEQLGLHLQPATQEAEILVIDSVEKVPTSN
jgi:uncharacterized protein (TIGR03435 family)